MEKVIFIDLEGNFIQYEDICSHVGLANKIVSDDDELKRKFEISNIETHDIFLISEIGYVALSIDDIYGFSLVINDEKITDIQRQIVNNYLKEGARLSILNSNNFNDEHGYQKKLTL